MLCLIIVIEQLLLLIVCLVQNGKQLVIIYCEILTVIDCLIFEYKTITAVLAESQKNFDACMLSSPRFRREARQHMAEC